MNAPTYIEPGPQDLIAELRILHDHFGGQLKTLPMRTCHNAMVRIQELESKLDAALKEIEQWRAHAAERADTINQLHESAELWRARAGKAWNTRS